MSYSPVSIIRHRALPRGYSWTQDINFLKISRSKWFLQGPGDCGREVGLIVEWLSPLVRKAARSAFPGCAPEAQRSDEPATREQGLELRVRMLANYSTRPPQ